MKLEGSLNNVISRLPWSRVTYLLIDSRCKVMCVDTGVLKLSPHHVEVKTPALRTLQQVVKRETEDLPGLLHLGST